MMLKILMLTIAYAEVMALRGQGTGHCMFTCALAHALGTAKRMHMP